MVVKQSPGEFLNNRRHGNGAIDYSTGDKYTGNWFDDKLHGHGEYTFANKDRYLVIYSNNS